MFGVCVYIAIKNSHTESEEGGRKEESVTFLRASFFGQRN